MKPSILKSATSRPPIIAAAAILVSFLLVHRPDLLLAQLQDQAGVAFDSGPPLVFAFLNQIILATTILALAWLLLVRLPPKPHRRGPVSSPPGLSSWTTTCRHVP